MNIGFRAVPALFLVLIGFAGDLLRRLFLFLLVHVAHRRQAVLLKRRPLVEINRLGKHVYVVCGTAEIRQTFGPHPQVVHVKVQMITISAVLTQTLDRVLGGVLAIQPPFRAPLGTGPHQQQLLHRSVRLVRGTTLSHPPTFLTTRTGRVLIQVTLITRIVTAATSTAVSTTTGRRRVQLRITVVQHRLRLLHPVHSNPTANLQLHRRRWRLLRGTVEPFRDAHTVDRWVGRVQRRNRAGAHRLELVLQLALQRLELDQRRGPAQRRVRQTVRIGTTAAGCGKQIMADLVEAESRFIVSPHEIFIHFQSLLLLLLIKFAVSGLPESPDTSVVSSVGGQRHVRRSRHNDRQLSSTPGSVEQFFIAAAVTACAFAVATGSVYPILLVLPSPFWRTDKVSFRHGILVRGRINPYHRTRVRPGRTPHLVVLGPPVRAALPLRGPRPGLSASAATA
uniref:(northern house mosquito) hypothetical protein n=1 Tax=Culex pipiens TaxID=7175 RepID=A0A8D8CRE8_CULPI